MKYNIVEMDEHGFVKNPDFVLASCNTRKLAEKYLKEMYETDRKLQKYYGWKRLPEYMIIESEEK